jgi:glucose/arabinose dehydrogenase
VIRTLIVIVILCWARAPSTVAQEAVILDQFALEAGLALTEVATDLPFPMGMVALPDGSLLVATSPPRAGNFYASSGELVRLADSDGDGTLDDRRVLAGNIPGSLVAVVRHGEIVIVTSAQSGSERIMFFRRGERWRDPFLPIEAINLHFRGALHQSYGLATRTNRENPDAFDLVLNIGAGGNDTAGEPVDYDGIISGTLQPASLYLMTVIDHGAEVEFGDPIQIAAGLRNASALAFHPKTGDLWIGENGIDGLTNPIEAFSADELNVIPADQIGTSVLDFGFPSSYVDYATGEVIGVDTAAVAFLPIDGDQAEGIAGIVFVPDSFPEGVAGGILAGFHGQFDLTGIENEENPIRWVDPETGEQRTLISNDSPGVGHIDSMVATEDTIYLADFCVASMTNSIGCGVIYRLTASS